MVNPKSILFTKRELKKLPDEEIVDLILKQGSSEYFTELYDRYALKIFQKCLSFTKDEPEAKDVAHDIIIKVYVNLSKFARKSKFSTWIYSISYNHCVDHQARKKKLRTLAEEIRLEAKDALQVEAHSDEELLGISVEALNLLLIQLSPGERSILLMKYQDEFSIKEISAITSCGESAVKMKLKRTKAKLMNLYEQSR